MDLATHRGIESLGGLEAAVGVVVVLLADMYGFNGLVFG